MRKIWKNQQKGKEIAIHGLQWQHFCFLDLSAWELLPSMIHKELDATECRDFGCRCYCHSEPRKEAKSWWKNGPCSNVTLCKIFRVETKILTLFDTRDIPFGLFASFATLFRVDRKLWTFTNQLNQKKVGRQTEFQLETFF